MLNRSGLDNSQWIALKLLFDFIPIFSPRPSFKASIGGILRTRSGFTGEMYWILSLTIPFEFFFRNFFIGEGSDYRSKGRILIFYSDWSFSKFHFMP